MKSSSNEEDTVNNDNKKQEELNKKLKAQIDELAKSSGKDKK